METEAGRRQPRGVAMETSAGLGFRKPGAQPAQNPAERLCEALAARWDPRKHSLLVVIGDIGTESQLRAVRAHLEQGEPLSWLRARDILHPRFSAICIHLPEHPLSLVCTC